MGRIGALATANAIWRRKSCWRPPLRDSYRCHEQTGRGFAAASAHQEEIRHEHTGQGSSRCRQSRVSRRRGYRGHPAGAPRRAGERNQRKHRDRSCHERERRSRFGKGRRERWLDRGSRRWVDGRLWDIRRDWHLRRLGHMRPGRAVAQVRGQRAPARRERARPALAAARDLAAARAAAARAPAAPARYTRSFRPSRICRSRSSPRYRARPARSATRACHA